MQPRSSFGCSSEHAPVGIAEVALSGALVRVNPEFCVISGYREPELLDLKLPKVDAVNTLGRFWLGTNEPVRVACTRPVAVVSSSARGAA